MGNEVSTEEKRREREQMSRTQAEILEELQRLRLATQNQPQPNMTRINLHVGTTARTVSTTAQSASTTTQSVLATASTTHAPMTTTSNAATGPRVSRMPASMQTCAQPTPSAPLLSDMSPAVPQRRPPPQSHSLESRTTSERLYPDLAAPTSPPRHALPQLITPSQRPGLSQRPGPSQRSLSPQVITPSKGAVKRDIVLPTKGRSDEQEKPSLSCACCGQRLRTAPIYQCSGGHSSCAECRAAARTCRVCTNPVTDMRSFALEVFIAQMKICCPNAKHGCKRMLTVDEEEAHERECRFAKDTPKVQCPVNADSSCSWIGATNMLADHFKQCHSERCGTEGTERTLPGFALEYDHTLVFLLNIEVFHFVLRIEVAGGTLRVAVQLVGTAFNANKWVYELHVFNKAEPRRKYFYSGTCSAIGTPAPPGAELACAYAASFLNREELVYKVYVKKQDDDSTNRKTPIDRTRDRSVEHGTEQEPSVDRARRPHSRQRVYQNKRFPKHQN